MDNVVTPLNTAYAREQAAQFVWPASSAELTPQNCRAGVQWLVDAARDGKTPENSSALSSILFTLLYCGGVFQDIASDLRTALDENHLDESQRAFIQAGLQETLTRVHSEITSNISKQSLNDKFYAANLCKSLLELKVLHNAFFEDQAPANQPAPPSEELIAVLG